jgi:hypothetical protein
MNSVLGVFDILRRLAKFTETPPQTDGFWHEEMVMKHRQK